ncbi:hypothetical protein Dthio_PD1554 [Desulfonatronospira thiodismutans ASO3-1]|uniref:Uncharacterized protein n=1 Tax=Desulfonatronospira thiodismutans ASO3-1 TaxID=555779 RepID=D6SN77_9BACT|nr:hypothetical protein [Desulfonatronospira thiodismutans]EFI34203.1 hypothetical protein Dthio_PD1554 [Desulfonatronospira thiodismutans ASO3-1]
MSNSTQQNSVFQVSSANNQSPRFVFVGNDGQDGHALWLTDGTEAGTELVKASDQDSYTRIFSMELLTDGQVLFDAGTRGLWITNGTQDGTRPVFDPGITYDSGPLEPADLTQVTDGIVVFSARSRGEPYLVRELWVSDGTPGGTRLLKEINPTKDNEGNALGSRPLHFHRLGDQVLFSAIDEGDMAANRSLWATDGTQGGTIRLLDSDTFYMFSPRSIGTDKLLFQCLSTDEDGTSYWVTDGTIAGTVPLGDFGLQPGSRFHTYAEPDGRVSFWSNGQWNLTDGTNAGTRVMGSAPGLTDEGPEPITFFRGGGEGPYPSQIFYSHAVTDHLTLYSARTQEISAEGNFIYGGNGLWLTDGTESGTDLVRLFDGRPRDFFTLDDGSTLFAVEGGSDGGLWVTDTTTNVMQKLAEGVFDLSGTHFRPTHLGDNRILFRTGEHLWVTDGTIAGTEQLRDDSRGVRLSLPDGTVLFTGTDSSLWSTDGTGDGTYQLIEEYEPFQIRDLLSYLEENVHSVELGGGRYIVPYATPEVGMTTEPFLMDTGTGSFNLISEINPDGWGTRALFMRLDSSAIDNILPPLRFSLEGMVSTLALDEFFFDPLGEELDYQVGGLPEGMQYDADSRAVTTLEGIAPGEHTITVTAANPQGDSVTDEFDWTVVDTGQLLIDSTGDWLIPQEDGPIYSELGSTILVGHKDGDGWLLRLEEGRVAIEDGTLEIMDGQFWSETLNLDSPLMEGSFNVDMQSLEVSEFEDTNSPDSYRLVAQMIGLEFADLTIRPDELLFDTDLRFGEGFVTLDTDGTPLLLSTLPEGPMFSPRMAGVGTGRWFKDDDALNLSVPGGSLSLELSNFGVYYDAVEDTFDFSGKAELSWGGKVQDQFRVIGVDTARSMELDLAGDAVDDDAGLFTRGENFLRFSPGSEEEPWSWDVSGSISYSAKSVPGYVETTRPLISELGLELDTTESSFGGNIKGQAPFLASGVELEIELGAFWDPIELEKLKLGLDGLNAPLGSTPFFIQGGELGVDGLSGRDEESALSYQGRIKTTLGPDTTVTPSPLHGSLGGEFTTGDIGLDFKIDSKVGYFVPGVVQSFTDPLVRWFGVNPARINDFTLLEATGDIEYDLAYGDIQTSLGIELLEGVVSAQAQLELYTRGDISHVDASMVATLHMPEAVPLIGGRGTSGTAMLEYVGDGNGQNSSVAAWRTIDLPFGLKTGVGLRADFAGNVELLGQRQIEEIGSWELHEDLSVVVLTARWEEAATDRTLELITPDETVLGEAEWSDHEDIVLVQELSDDYGRAVALQNPARGTWDLRLSDESGLGEVTYDASEMFQGPSTEILSVEVDAGSDQVHIVFDTELQDADSGVVQLYASLSPETVDELGRRITTDAIEVVQGQQEYVWDYREMAPGTYYVNAVTTAEGLAPDHAFSDEPVEVVGSADLVLSVEQEKGPIEETFLLTFTVSNEGERDSGSGILSIDVPESLVGYQPDSEFQSFTDKVTEVNFENIAAGDSADFEFLIPADFEDPAVPLQAQVQAAVYDADPSRNQILYGLFPASEEEQDDDDDPLLQDFEFHTQVDIAVGSPFSELFTDVQAMYTHYQVWTGRIEDGIVLDGNSSGWIPAEHLDDYSVGYENLEHNTLYVQGWKQGAPPGGWHSNAWRDGDYFDFPGPPEIEFNVDSDISVGTSFSELFTDQDDTTTWYQLWTGELDQEGVVQGSVVDTEAGGGWVRAEDLNGLQVTGDQAGHNTIYVQAYSPELGMRDWQSNDWQNQEYFGFPEPWGYELAAQHKLIVHLDDGSKGNVADLPVAVADYVNSDDSGSLALQGVQDEQDSGDLFS